MLVASVWVISAEVARLYTTAASMVVRSARVIVSALDTSSAVNKTYFLTKIDAVLGYFEIIISEKPRKIGFSRPENWQGQVQQ